MRLKTQKIFPVLKTIEPGKSWGANTVADPTSRCQCSRNSSSSAWASWQLQGSQWARPPSPPCSMGVALRSSCVHLRWHRHNMRCPKASGLRELMYSFKAAQSLSAWCFRKLALQSNSWMIKSPWGYEKNWLWRVSPVWETRPRCPGDSLYHPWSCLSAWNSPLPWEDQLNLRSLLGLLKWW